MQYTCPPTRQVTMDHFNSAMGQCNPSSLRETVVEVPNIKSATAELRA